LTQAAQAFRPKKEKVGECLGVYARGAERSKESMEWAVGILLIMILVLWYLAYFHSKQIKRLSDRVEALEKGRATEQPAPD
jgi:hypothetical protein